MQISLPNVNVNDLTKYVELQAQRAQLDKATKIVKLFRDYYDGKQDVMLTDRQKEFISPVATWSEEFPFSHNVCAIVVDTIEEHLNVDDVTSEDEALTDFLSLIMEANDFDLLQKEVYTESLTQKVSFVMVDLDDNNIPRLRLHKPFDGKTGILKICLPNSEEVLCYQNFFYTVQDNKTLYRKTVYYFDRIEKFVFVGGAWVRYQTEGEEWPILWDRGWFIVEFNNKYSEVGKILSQQNLLNKVWLDIIASSDSHGFPLSVLEYPEEKIDFGKDDENITGDDELLIGPDRMLRVYGATFERIQPGDITSLLDTLWAVTVAISSITKVPQYMLRPMGIGSNSSGESLKQSKGPLLKKVESKQKIFGNAWQQVFTVCQNLTTEEAPKKVSLVWMDIDTSERSETIEQAKFENELGLPIDVTMRTLGRDAEEITDIKNKMLANRANEIRQVAQELNNGS